MFARFLSTLMGPDAGPLPRQDASLALAALLVRLARADDSYLPAEISRIDQILMARYGLSPFEATELRARAEALETEAPDTVRFTRAIKDAVPHEDRKSLMRAIWSVALADGTRDAEEDTLIRLVAELLGVSDQESALARQSVENRR
ncbi:MAG: TerB family tellurite resistance protein [Rhodobacteraceae bacterium]|nr:TerB family tellurite resistance protein [Paracoccaceae bacterium]